MVLTAHNFWRHIAGRAGSVLRVLLAPITSDTKVGDAEVALVVDDQVLWLDITVNNRLFVAVLEAGDEAGHKEA